MKQTITNVYQFRDAFNLCGRGKQFSYEGLASLWEYLEQYEEDTGEELELDVIAFCCDFSEESPEDIAQSYGVEMEEDESTIEEAVRAYLEDNGAFVGFGDNGTIVYRNDF